MRKIETKRDLSVYTGVTVGAVSWIEERGSVFQPLIHVQYWVDGHVYSLVEVLQMRKRHVFLFFGVKYVPALGRRKDLDRGHVSVRYDPNNPKDAYLPQNVV